MKIKIREAVDKNGESLVFLTDDELNILQQALRQYKGCFAHDKKEDLNGVDIRNHENSLGLAGRMAETVERSLMEIYHNEQMNEWYLKMLESYHSGEVIDDV